ncbi:myoD family inhibitor isoform X1 [Alosa alosa]|nr:myoD family inhibitor isoform X1 [Alosa alosa]XP_048097838.1 myoD family inhibitor isoform X1 [Alosa alosa]
MDVHPQAEGAEVGRDRPKSVDNLQNHCLQHATKEAEDERKEAPLSGRPDQSSSNESITDVGCTNDDTLLLPNHKPIISQTVDKDDPHLQNPVVSNQPVAQPLQEGVANGAPPICTPPAASVALVKPGAASPQKCNGHSLHHHHPHKKRLPSTTKSQQSFKTNAAQIQEVAGDDCCVHCVLACLFCELTSLCSVFAQCLTCGGLGCEALCCCGEAATGGLACGEDACSALLDCGILEDCCQSSDCLEICLECCAICFPA